MITQPELKELLHYDPDTGFFIRKTKATCSAEIGSIVGSPDSYGYIAVNVKGCVYRAHRLAWFYVYGVWPTEQIDHINHVRDDNRWINLREATHRENQRNRKISKNNTSGVCGVCWHKTQMKWFTKIKINSKYIHLGVFTDKFEAICARLSANNKYGFHENHGR